MRKHEHEQMTTQQQEFFGQNLPRLEHGEVEVDEFLRKAEELEQLLVRDALIHTPDFNEWAAFFRENYPEVAEDSIRHEQAHARVAARYGVSVMYGLVEITDSEFYDFGTMGFGTIAPTYVQAFLTDNSRDVARREKWNSSKLLQYIHELATAPDSPSDGDRSMFNGRG